PARLYHPETGRFTTRDPHPTPLNKYQAFSAEPVNFVDPSGNIQIRLNQRNHLGDIEKNSPIHTPGSLIAAATQSGSPENALPRARNVPSFGRLRAPEADGVTAQDESTNASTHAPGSKTFASTNLDATSAAMFGESPDRLHGGGAFEQHFHFPLQFLSAEVESIDRQLRKLLLPARWVGAIRVDRKLQGIKNKALAMEAQGVNRERLFEMKGMIRDFRAELHALQRKAIRRNAPPGVSAWIDTVIYFDERKYVLRAIRGYEIQRQFVPDPQGTEILRYSTGLTVTDILYGRGG
ncbi:RHS repeat-associated core domain-containing protein, partial [Streptomyces sp. NRRL F-2664]|uniref:RHS repeat-associated core domain-containing protein n=1 Tax=Streptomyces sp. NRRL F-2664 TaxID=1463842 RepID=UPI0018FE9EC7